MKAKMRFFFSPPWTVSLSLFLLFITYYGTASCRASSHYRNPGSRSPPRSPPSLKEHMTTFSFSSRDQCMRVLCSSRNVQLSRQQILNIARRPSVDTQNDNLIDPIPESRQESDDTPPLYPGMFSSFDDIQAVLGNSYTEIRDDSGRIIGVAPSDNSVGGLSNDGRPNRRKPTTNVPGNRFGVGMGFVAPGMYGGLGTLTTSPGTSFSFDALQRRFGQKGFNSFQTFEKDDDDDGNTGQRDSDVCCQTREVFYINSTLTDFFGVSHTIAQFKQVGSYQFIRHGVCGAPGLCEGNCVQKFITMPLVIAPTVGNQKVSFSFFKIPGYCTCKVARFAGR